MCHEDKPSLLVEIISIPTLQHSEESLMQAECLELKKTPKLVSVMLKSVLKEDSILTPKPDFRTCINTNDRLFTTKR